MSGAIHNAAGWDVTRNATPFSGKGDYCIECPLDKPGGMHIHYLSYNPASACQCNFTVLDTVTDELEDSLFFNNVPAGSVVAKDFKQNFFFLASGKILAFVTSIATDAFTNVCYSYPDDRGI